MELDDVRFTVQSLVTFCIFFFRFRLLSDQLIDFFAAESPGLHNSGEESFSSTRERSVSEPNVFRSRIISGNAPLVSAYLFCAYSVWLNQSQFL